MGMKPDAGAVWGEALPPASVAAWGEHRSRLCHTAVSAEPGATAIIEQGCAKD